MRGAAYYRCVHITARSALVACLICVLTKSATADFRMCNNTGSRVGVAIGYKDAEDWTTEGWWNLPSHMCETMLKGNLAARYYYVYAVDYDHGGEWMGQAYLCTRDRTFTIRGTNDCLARGYDRTGFFEVDTGGEQRAWTVQLIESSEQSSKRSPNSVAPSSSAPGNPPPVSATAPLGAQKPP
jgi:uncharacterized membrane protein